MKFIDLFIPTNRNKFRAYLLKAEIITIITLIVFVFNIFISKLPISQSQARIDLNSIVYLHNRERAKLDLSHLALNSKLIDSATQKAKIMLKFNCWDHYCPPGSSPWKFFKESGYEYLYAGENLAEGFSDNSIMMQAWMNSPTHKENVLKPEFSEIGIGYVMGDFQDRKNNTVVAVHFGKPFEQIPAKKEIKVKQEVREFNLQNHIRIFYPKQNSYINNKFVPIKGEVHPSIKKVEVKQEGKVLSILDVFDNNFQFNSGKQFSFNDGKQIVYVSGLNQENEVISNPQDVIFTVDTVIPTIVKENILVSEIQEEEDTFIKIEIHYNDQLEEAKLIIDKNNFQAYKQNGLLEFKVKLERIKKAENIELYLEDKAGNTNNIKIVPDQILNKIEKIELEYSALRNNKNISFLDRIKVIPSEVEFDKKIFNTKNVINLFIIVVLILLLWLDYKFIARYNINIQRHGNQHIKIGLLITIGLISLISGGIGHILTGVNI